VAQPEDGLLVRRCKNGDMGAFEELVRRYETRAYNMAYRFMGNHVDAGDLAQEAFIRAYRSIKSFRGDASFSTWFYRIVSNVCCDEIRKRHRHKTVSLDEAMAGTGVSLPRPKTEPSPEEWVEREETGEWIQKQLDSLTPEHRLIIVMRDIQGFSYEEMADYLGCSLGTVKSRLNRARQNLKQKILVRQELCSGELRLPGKNK